MINKIKEPNPKGIHFSFPPKKQLSARRLFELAEENYENGSPWSLAGFEEDLKNPHAHYLIAGYGTDIIGYIGYHQIVDEAEVTNIVVDKPFQQSGVASELLRLCSAKWLSEQVVQAFLEVRESNQAAIKLYQKVSFTIIGKRKNYYANPREDALIMQWNV